MRLINVDTFQLEEFFDDSIPSYAILSHTWGNEELSLQDYSTCYRSDSPLRKKAGFVKIRETCRTTKENGLKYCWVDTICIDKTSSAELTEAINSMFRWYSIAICCFVHLEDYEWKAKELIDISHCRWLTRGWCLQELIAPKNLCFYDATWRPFATKNELIEPLSRWTGIDQGILDHIVSLEEVPICTRMSWASQRKTSRLEDRAYCLLGIIQVNMPMLYGEGTNAFRRLQEEALRVHDDPSIFLWRDDVAHSISNFDSPMLALDVADFSTSHNIRFIGDGSDAAHPIFSHSSRGICVKGAELKLSKLRDCYLLSLGTLTERGTSRREVLLEIGLMLRKRGPGTYIRLGAWFTGDFYGIDDLVKPEDEIYIMDHRPKASDLHGGISSARFSFEVQGSNGSISCLVVEPRPAWDSLNSRFIADRRGTFAAYARIQPMLERFPVLSLDWFVIAIEMIPERKEADRRSRPKGITAYLIPDSTWAIFRSMDRDWDAQRLVDLVYAHGAVASSRISGSTRTFETDSFIVRAHAPSSWQTGPGVTITVSWSPKV